MKRIGLVGEDPNDTRSIKNLLLKKYKSKVHFFQLAKNIRGHQLDNPKIKRSLPIEFKNNKCHFIIYIRDLDGFKSETSKVEQKYNWFKGLDAEINNEGVFLLNIWELEALILADIKTFNDLYKVSFAFKANPMFQKDPKEKLMEVTSNGKREYKESHCPEIFEKLDFDTVKDNCKYFEDFLEEVDEKLSQ